MGGDCTVVAVIGAVVVTYNAPAATVTACLRALRDAGGLDRCLLVDTGGRAEVPAELADLVEVVVVPNRGYGAAVNTGWRRLRDLGADVVAVLNDDVVVRPGWIEELAPVLGGRIGVVQPVIVGSGPGAGSVSSLGVEFDRYGAGVDLGLGGPLPAAGEVRPLEVFTGGAFVAASAFLEATEGFDERWFLYYEDADLACRGRELGWEYRLVTDAVVEHMGGVSTSADSDLTRYLQERNRLLFAARHLPARALGRAVWLSVRRLRHPPRWVHARAFAAGLVRMPVWLAGRRRGRRVSDGRAD
jgi:N-acetylglucosaminyl-diphospho-decaprenol L-rhamnosyltransferase